MTQIYKNFRFLRKRHLSDEEFDTMFDIISDNMSHIGFALRSGDKSIWVNNLQRNLDDEHFYIYLIYFNGDICGFIEIMETHDGITVSEIQFNQTVRSSKLILYTIDFILNEPAFCQHRHAYFSINKNNALSSKTFTHLGAQICGEKQNSYQYEIDRTSAQKYIDKLTKK